METSQKDSWVGNTWFLTAMAVLFIPIWTNSPVLAAPPEDVVFWNTLGSDQEIWNSETGPGGSIADPVSYTAARLGTGVSLDSVKSLVSFDGPLGADARFPDAGTIAVWFKAGINEDDYTDARRFLFHLSSDALNWFRWPKASIRVRYAGRDSYRDTCAQFHVSYYMESPSYTVCFDSKFLKGDLVHVAVVWDKSWGAEPVRLFINGRQGGRANSYRKPELLIDTIQSLLEESPGHDLEILRPAKLFGTDYSADLASSFEPDTVMDDIRIFGRRLSDSELAALARGPVPPGGWARCPGDINGDNVADIAVISSDGKVRIKDLKGRMVRHFSFTSVNQITDVELLPDMNGNGAPEIAALGTGSTLSEVRDMLTGARLNRTWYDPDLNPIDLEVMNDHNGNGVPELAHLGEGSVKVAIKDAKTSSPLKLVNFNRHMLPRDLEIFPDWNRNGADDLSVLQEHENPNRSDKVEIRDLNTAAKLKDIWLGGGWEALQHEVIADNNGNGYEEVAVLRKKNDASRVTAIVRDGKTGASLKTIFFDKNYPPTHLLTLADANGNRSDELLVFGRRFDGANQRAQIKDSKTGQKVRDVWFNKNYPAEDITISPDLNGNGSKELVMLGRHSKDGSLRAFVKDSKTGAQVGQVSF